MCQIFDDAEDCCDQNQDGEYGICCCCWCCWNNKSNDQIDDEIDVDGVADRVEQNRHRKKCRCCCCCFHCPPRCLRNLLQCLNPSRCFTYSHWITLIRFIFLLVHTLLIATSIFGLIWSNVYFDDFDQIWTGSIVGGHLVTLSAGGILFGLSGLYAVIKHHRRLLYTHTVLNPWIMSIGLLELVLALLSTVLLRDALIYF
ncbi:hypothetical protein SSS_07590 [Sarcoptes scabiei]|uniref:Uncharacterized protein n=1 Tax=Sarcoptes scabiei TaxID=52283 RepID=A0A834VBH1_SARSC|nr:hypothetical protein SSS_07590 [Sarcoptes scabiei]